MLVFLIAYTILLPGFMAGLVGLLSWPPWQKNRRSFPSWGHPTALSLACVVGYYFILDFPPFPPLEAMHWTFYLAIISGCVGAMGAGNVWPWLIKIGLLGGSTYVIVKPLLGQPDMPRETYLFLFLFNLIAVGGWYVLEQQIGKANKWCLPGLIVIFSVSSLTCVLAESASLGQLLGVLTSALGGLLVLSWFKGTGLTPGALAVVYGVGFSLLLNAYLYSGLSGYSLSLLLFSPLALGFKLKQQFPTLFLQVLLIFSCLGGAVALTIWDNPISGDESSIYPDTSEPDSNYGY